MPVAAARHRLRPLPDLLPRPPGKRHAQPPTPRGAGSRAPAEPRFAPRRATRTTARAARCSRARRPCGRLRRASSIPRRARRSATRTPRSSAPSRTSAACASRRQTPPRRSATRSRAAAPQRTRPPRCSPPHPSLLLPLPMSLLYTLSVDNNTVPSPPPPTLPYSCPYPCTVHSLPPSLAGARAAPRVRPRVRRPPPSLPYKVDTSRPSLRTNWTRLVPFPHRWGAARRAFGAVEAYHGSALENFHCILRCGLRSFRSPSAPRAPVAWRV